ncbi:hypothetical protein AA0112_g10209 [Alternaria arborescens]|uniref:hypothetical protein n=1 Tax=Alternaria arborescens TaxID=156630 RepID=UPI001074C0DE|nr:hypothetical protein AA0111_g11630 [Alternaria arborescens]RYN21539.1 hypothetical protein AA0112_g10209 [Alternaria arborescens]RYO15727.1 hypothetical protein AA0111_g11630 [Alternaria arborescens]
MNLPARIAKVGTFSANIIVFFAASAKDGPSGIDLPWVTDDLQNTSFKRRQTGAFYKETTSPKGSPFFQSTSPASIGQKSIYTGSR